ncbi:hypothetical protein A3860_02555 [Niastella vici]|uniref:LRAT domain-containing protein n=1 Tax=Niastella vici TaxID=1703345 RepID=A0A1V9G9C0_9BACT|nr:lecithin retinol acyltransferase family protein [Niastella vici]OQP67261.1 hypothetical protein A3860_02555 [Niastella vici]
MDLGQFVAAYQVKPADAVVVRKENLGIFDHYVIYLGKDRFNQHKFIANYGDGIKFISNDEFIKFVRTYVPVKINRFTGTETQRSIAVRRALSRLNEKAYNLIINNCEHFANWVQRGLPSSEQVENFGKGMAVVGGIITLTGLTTKNKNAALIGGLIASLGLMMIGVSVVVDNKEIK